VVVEIAGKKAYRGSRMTPPFQSSWRVAVMRQCEYLLAGTSHLSMYLRDYSSYLMSWTCYSHVWW